MGETYDLIIVGGGSGPDSRLPVLPFSWALMSPWWRSTAQVATAPGLAARVYSR